MVAPTLSVTGPGQSIWNDRITLLVTASDGTLDTTVVGPAGSTATVVDPATTTPSLTPDIGRGQYLFTVKATNIDGTTTVTHAVDVFPMFEQKRAGVWKPARLDFAKARTAQPAAPTGLTGVVNADFSVSLDWADYTGASEFRVYEDKTTTGPIGTSLTSAFTTGPIPDSTWAFSVTAIVNGVESARSSKLPISTTPNIQTTSISVTPAAGDTDDLFTGTATLTSDIAVTLDHVVIGTRLVGQSHTDPTAGDFTRYSSVTIPAGGSVTIPASSRTFGTAGDLYAYVAWGRNGKWSRDLDPQALFTVAPITEVGGLPPKVVGEWQSIFATDPPSLQALVDRLPARRPNLVSLAVAQSAESGTGKLNFPNGDGSVVNATMVANAKAAGLKVILLIGGAGFAGSCLDTLDKDQLVASAKTIIDTYGLQGIDWNFEGGSTQFAITPSVDAIRELRAHYGRNFVVNAAPRPYEVRATTDHYHQFLTALHAEGLLDCAFLQFYDNNAWSDPAFLLSQGSSDLNGLIADGIPAKHLGVACITQPGYDVNGDGIGDGNTPQAYLDLYNNVPGLRGTQHWWTKFGAAVSEPYCELMNANVLTAWRTAKDAFSESQMLQHMLAITGPRIASTGTHTPATTVNSQAACDAMKGKTIVGDVTFAPPSGTTLIVEDAIFLGRRVNYAVGGGRTLLRYCTVDGNDQTYSPDHHRLRGNVTHENVRVRRCQDGYKIGDANYSGDVVLRDVLIHEPSQQIGSLTDNQTHQDGIQVMGGSFDGERVYIDYENNHSGGQGILVKADARAITKFRLVDYFLKAGGDMMTYEPKSSTDPSPGTIDLGSGHLRGVVAPAADMRYVLSLYEPNGTMDEPARGTLLTSSFFVAEKNGAALTYKNGISKTTLDAVQAL